MTPPATVPALVTLARVWVGRPTPKETRLRPGQVLALWAVCLPAVLVLSVLITAAARAAGYDPSRSRVVTFTSTAWPPTVIFQAAVMAPVLEETAFRAGLTLKRWHVAIGCAAFIVLYGAGLVGLDPVPPGVSRLGTIATVSWVVVEVMLAAGAIWALAGAVAGRGWSQHGRSRTAVMTIATLVFALSHALNYPGVGRSPWLIPLLTLPQLLVGVVLAGVRLGRGWRAAVAIHALHNLVFVSASLISERSPSEAVRALTAVGLIGLVMAAGVTAGVVLGAETYRWFRVAPNEPTPYLPVTSGVDLARHRIEQVAHGEVGIDEVQPPLG